MVPPARIHRLLLTAAAAVAFLFPRSARPDGLDISGYTVHHPTIQSYDPGMARSLGFDEHSLQLWSALRLKPEIVLSKRTRLTAEYELSGLYSSTGILISPAAGKTSRQISDLTWKSVSEPHYTLIHKIDRLYFRHESSGGEIVLGRQRISWGTGRVWNPTDLFNPINPADLYQIEKPGADALSLKIFLGPFDDIQLVIQPGEDIDGLDGGVRYRTHAGEYDLSLVGGRFDRRLTLGGDLAGNLFEAGLRAEAVAFFDVDGTGGDFSRWIIGLDYQFTPEIYSLIEYHFNGEGMKDPESYEPGRLKTGDILNLGRRFLFARTDYLFHPLWNLSISVDQSITDGSGLASCLVTWSASGSIDAVAGVRYTYGDPFEEFSYYPTSFYMKGTLYF